MSDFEKLKEYAKEAGGEYLIKIKGGLEHYAIWSDSHHEFRLKIAPDIVVSDEQILEYREV